MCGFLIHAKGMSEDERIDGDGPPSESGCQFSMRPRRCLSINSLFTTYIHLQSRLYGKALKRRNISEWLCFSVCSSSAATFNT